MGEKAFQIETRFVDSSTGEIVFTSRKTFTFFCHNDGENYIDKMVESFKRGLRQRDNLSLEFVCNRVLVDPVPFPDFF